MWARGSVRRAGAPSVRAVVGLPSPGATPCGFGTAARPCLPSWCLWRWACAVAGGGARLPARGAVLALGFSREPLAEVGDFELEGGAGPAEFEPVPMGTVGDLNTRAFNKSSIREAYGSGYTPRSSGVWQEWECKCIYTGNTWRGPDGRPPRW